jgi:hypothetical protein
MARSLPDPHLRTRPARRPRLLLAAVLLALLGSGCGAKPPQAPASEASAINTTVSELASRCGEAREILTTGEGTARLPALDHAAMGRATPLLSVLRKNAAWIYQGDTVAEIVKTWAADLAGCGLSRTAGELARAQP